MAIPEAQLEVWSKQGAITTAKVTHESVRAALGAPRSPIVDRISDGSVIVHLQGSYKNDTNIRGDSDVDVVVKLNETFGHNAHELPKEQRELHEVLHDTATYRWDQFRNDVITALVNYYGQGSIDVSGNKSIKLKAAPGRLKADIVPVINFKKYNYYYGSSSQSFEEGIRFYHRTTNRAINNFPIQFYENGVAKHSERRTNGWFKPTVRIFKNARTYLIDRGLLADGIAPSYFLQSWIYNVPDNLFGTDYQTTFCNVINYLRRTSFTDCVSQNGIDPLFGETGEQWRVADATTTLDAFIKLWNEWN